MFFQSYTIHYKYCQEFFKLHMCQSYKLLLASNCLIFKLQAKQAVTVIIFKFFGCVFLINHFLVFHMELLDANNAFLNIFCIILEWKIASHLISFNFENLGKWKTGYCSWWVILIFLSFKLLVWFKK